MLLPAAARGIVRRALLALAAQALGLDAPRRWMDAHRWARPLAASFALFLALTLVLSLVRVARRAASPRAQRARTVDLNKARACPVGVCLFWLCLLAGAPVLARLIWRACSWRACPDVPVQAGGPLACMQPAPGPCLQPMAWGVCSCAQMSRLQDDVDSCQLQGAQSQMWHVCAEPGGHP